MSHRTYKAKRKSDDAWIEGYYRELPTVFYSDGKSTTILKGYITVPDAHSTGRRIEHEVYTDTVCEYTGVNDKNSSRIFEHDRCRLSRPMYSDAVGEIKFSQGCYYFVEDETRNCIELCNLRINEMEVEVLREKEEKDGND